MRPILVPETGMNATERKYGELLALRKAAGEIVDFMWEPMRLILAHNIPNHRSAVTYLPDFLLIHSDHFEFVEIKMKRGKWTSMKDDARAKVNIASALFDFFKWTVVYYENGIWTEEHLN